MAKEKQVRAPSMIEALIPIIVMMGLMIYCLNVDKFYVDAHMPLVVSIAFSPVRAPRRPAAKSSTPPRRH